MTAHFQQKRKKRKVKGSQTGNMTLFVSFRMEKKRTRLMKKSINKIKTSLWWEKQHEKVREKERKHSTAVVLGCYWLPESSGSGQGVANSYYKTHKHTSHLNSTTLDTQHTQAHKQVVSAAPRPSALKSTQLTLHLIVLHLTVLSCWALKEMLNEYRFSCKSVLQCCFN